MQHTIRHDTTGRAIVAYLATVATSRTTRHLAAYMTLMHSTPPHCTLQALSDLAQRGMIMRVRRGRYQRGGNDH
jgi:hypothetical protein